MQSRGSTRGDVPPVDGGPNPQISQLDKIRRVMAWVVWFSFCISLGLLAFVGWRVITIPSEPGQMPWQAFIGLCSFTGSAALILRYFRGRASSLRLKSNLLMLGLACGETVALNGFILRMTNSQPQMAPWFFIVAGLLHLMQAPVDFSSRAAPPTEPPGVTVV